jgi:hypothetical protein
MRGFKLTLLTTLFAFTFGLMQASAQLVDTVYSNSFETPLNFNPSQGINRTNDSASDGSYCLAISNYPPGSGELKSFNLSSISPRDTFVLAVDIYKTNPVESGTNPDFDAIKFELVPNKGRSVLDIGLFYRNTQKGEAVNSPGWKEVRKRFTGKQLLEQTSGDKFNLKFLALGPLNNGDSYDMAIDNIRLLEINDPEDFVYLRQPRDEKALKQEQTYEIQWTNSNSVDRVNIAYSSDNGASWDAIRRQVDASKGFYKWVAPAQTTENGLIRVKASGKDIIGVSNSAFTIKTAKPKIRMSRLAFVPNPGFEMAQPRGVSWYSQNTERIDIELKVSSGSPWQTIADSISVRSGFYRWVVPDTNTVGAQLRILNADGRNYGDSSKIFYIQREIAFPKVTLKTPFQKDFIQTNTTYPIEWAIGRVKNPRDSPIKKVDIELSKDNGNSWQTIASEVDASQSTYEWSVPANPVNKAEIRVVASRLDSITDQNSSLVSSSGAFAIIEEFNQLSISQPSIGDTISGGTKTSIKWTASKDVGPLSIEYSEDNGNSWNKIASAIIAKSGVYEWEAPNKTIKKARIRIVGEMEASTRAQTKAFYIGKTTGISRVDQQQHLTVYPNPVRERLQIEIPEKLKKQKAKVQVLNSKGKLINVNRYPAFQNALSLNVENLPSGLYFIQVKSKDSTYVGKFAKY